MNQKYFTKNTLKNISAEHTPPDDERICSNDETFIIKMDMFITKIWQ